MIKKINCLGDRIEIDDSALKNIGFNPYYPVFNSEQTDPMMINGKKMINLATNNYLGLSNDRRIKQAYIYGIRKYGISMCATPIAGGYTELFDKVRDELSGFIGIDDVLLYPSCFQANNGIFQCVARKDDLILFDRFAHSSLIQGIRSVGCKSLPFSHNDTASLEYLLNKMTAYEKVFVVTESVFSTEGSIAPFREIYRLCKKFSAIPVVDDSHGIGVIGKNGKGILSHSGIANYEGIYTASLGKALANNCGVIGGSSELIRYLSFFSPHLVYSTAVQPAVLSGIVRTLEIIRDEYEEKAARIFNYSSMIRNSLNDNGFRVAKSEAPITSLITRSTEETIAFARLLFINDILSTPFVYPSVPRNDGRIRMIAGANLKEESIDRVMKLFRNIRLN
jgi:7-keto-8-aminopelargonate synthetase-like enzyme